MSMIWIEFLVTRKNSYTVFKPGTICLLPITLAWYMYIYMHGKLANKHCFVHFFVDPLLSLFHDIRCSYRFKGVIIFIYKCSRRPIVPINKLAYGSWSFEVVIAWELPNMARKLMVPFLDPIPDDDCLSVSSWLGVSIMSLLSSHSCIGVHQRLAVKKLLIYMYIVVITWKLYAAWNFRRFVL